MKISEAQSRVELLRALQQRLAEQADKANPEDLPSIARQLVLVSNKGRAEKFL